ncbi:MAG: hypothetical protein M3238_02885, partial [Actinomycetota bacterium]|nr:hypothetical protein [Actinomycetota bacterium]
MRRAIACMFALALGLALAVGALTPAAAQPPPPPSSGGPVVLMGIDAENGGPGGHGPPATYTRLVNNILAQVTKPAAEVVVVGCKPGTGTGNFWAAVFPGHRCVTGGPAILAETFLTARLVAVVSDQPETPDGGLRCSDEDPALDDPSTQAE